MTTAYAYMTVVEAMKVLGLSRQRIYALIAEGRLSRFYMPGRRRGMVPRLLADEVYAYAEARKARPPKPPKPPKKPPRKPPAWLTEPRTPTPHIPVTEEDRIVAVLVLTGIVDMTDVFRAANRRIMAEFDASELVAADFVNAGR